MNYFNSTLKFNNSEDEIQSFLDIIYHDKKKGNNVVLYKKDGEDAVSVSKVYLAEDLMVNADTNVYASMSTFSGKRRLSDEVFNRSVMVIDLDSHIPSYKIVKENTAKLLSEAFDEDKLPKPTMIVDSGRGYHIYYVFEKSVSNADNLAKMNKRYNYTYDKLIEAFKNTLAIDNGSVFCDVDTCVTDSARVMRVPGTWNTKTGEKAKLIYLNKNNGKIQYVNKFVDLSKYNPFTLEDVKAKKAEIYSGNKGYYGDVAEKMMLVNRYNNLCKVMKKRKNIPEHNREMICFIAYNTMLQVGDEAFARQKLEEINNISNYPLKSKELNGIEKGLRGKNTYNFTNKTICNTLNLDDEEIGFFNNANKRKIKEALLKMENKLSNELRKYEIALFIKKNEDIRLYQIADMFDCSLRYIKKVANQYNIHRYGCYNGSEINDELKKKVHEIITVLCCDIKKAYGNVNSLSESDIEALLSDDVKQQLDAIFENKLDLLTACVNETGITHIVSSTDNGTAVLTPVDEISDVSTTDNKAVATTTVNPVVDTSIFNPVVYYAYDFLDYLCDNCVGKYQSAARGFRSFLSTVPDEECEYKGKLLTSVAIIGKAYETMPVIDNAVYDLNSMYATSRDRIVKPTIGGKAVKRTVIEIADGSRFEWHPELSAKAIGLDAFKPLTKASIRKLANSYGFSYNKRMQFEEAVSAYQCVDLWMLLMNARNVITPDRAKNYDYLASQLCNMGNKRINDYIFEFAQAFDPYYMDGAIRNMNGFVDEVIKFTLKFLGKEKVSDVKIKPRNKNTMSEKQYLARKRYIERMWEKDAKEAFLNSPHVRYVENQVCYLYKCLRAVPYKGENTLIQNENGEFVTNDRIKSVVWNSNLQDLVDYVELLDADFSYYSIPELYHFLNKRTIERGGC